MFRERSEITYNVVSKTEKDMLNSFDHVDRMSDERLTKIFRILVHNVEVQDLFIRIKFMIFHGKSKFEV